MRVIPAVCAQCGKTTTVYTKSGNMMYTIPNCKHHGVIKEDK